MTEPARVRVAPRLALSPQEWRLYILAVLALVYAGVWRAITASAPPTAAPETVATPATAADAVPAALPPARWLDDVPLGERPAFAVPAGWRVLARGEPVTAPVGAPAPRVVRAPATRRLRVRTRSS